MKYFIASDIHGSEYYCKEMINAFNKEEANAMILLGDILYHGPRNALPRDYNTNGVLTILNEYKDKITCVRGNCDAEVDQWVLEFPILDEYRLIETDGIKIYLTHGHHELPTPPQENDIVISGHTHIPRCEKVDGVLYLNPGSVSIPKERSPHGYIVYENRTFIWKDFEGREYMRYSE